MHQLVKKSEEVRDHQIADVEPVHISIGCQDYLLVPQVLQGILDVQAAHEIVQLVVLINDVSLKIPDIQRFAFQNKDRLVVHIPATDNRPGSRLAFGQEGPSSHGPCSSLCQNDVCNL